MSVRTFHMVLDAGIDRFPDAKIRRDFLPMFARLGAFTVDDVRRLCREYRAKGYKVFPSCDHHDARGMCLGHEVVDVPCVEDPAHPHRCGAHGLRLLQVDGRCGGATR